EDSAAQYPTQVIEVFGGRIGFNHQPPLVSTGGLLRLHGTGTTAVHAAACLFNRRLDVIREVVAAPDDDQIAIASTDVQLSVATESGVTGTQIRSRAVRGRGAECLRGLLRPAPVPVGQTRSANPDLADSAIGQDGPPLR